MTCEVIQGHFNNRNTAHVGSVADKVAPGHFNNRNTAHVGSVADKVAPGQVFPRVFRFSPVSIILPMLHTHTYINDAHSLGN
jgi:hypothetical protein